MGFDAKSYVLPLPKKRQWRCPKRHEWTGEDSYTKILFTQGDGPTVDSGPLCFLCLCDFLRQNFPANKVIEEA